MKVVFHTIKQLLSDHKVKGKGEIRYLATQLYRGFISSGATAERHLLPNYFKIKLSIQSKCSVAQTTGHSFFLN